MGKNPYRHFPQKALPPEPVWNEGHAVGKVEGWNEALVETEKAIEKEMEHWQSEKGDSLHENLAGVIINEIKALRKQPSQESV